MNELEELENEEKRLKILLKKIRSQIRSLKSIKPPFRRGFGTRSNHGHCNGGKMSPIYSVWKSMMKRCRSHPDYAGRGIRVVDRWHEFENFLMDMGNRPVGTTLDRRNNDGNYSPSNCRWATGEIQARNKRNNRIVVFQGRSMTITEASKISGICPKVVVGRLRTGWTLEDSLSIPVRPKYWSQK